MIHCIMCVKERERLYKVHYWVNGQNWNSSGILKLLKLHENVFIGWGGGDYEEEGGRREGANEIVNRANC